MGLPIDGMPRLTAGLPVPSGAAWSAAQALAAACGGDNFAPQPTLASFSATPQALPAGGGQVVLSWSTANASQISNLLHNSGILRRDGLAR